MEAYHHMALFQDCLLCVVNMTWIFTITSQGPECIPNILAFSGTLHEYADIKQDCETLPFHFVPLPNITEEEFEEWLGVSITTAPTTLPTTSIPSDLEKCYDCVHRGRFFVKLRTGDSVCVLDPSDFSNDRVLFKTANPRRCELSPWDDVAEPEWIVVTEDKGTTTEFSLSTIPEPEVLSAGFIFGVVSVLGVGVLIVVAAWLFYLRRRRVRGDDEEGLQGSVLVNRVFFQRRSEGINELDGMEMTEM